MHINKQQQFDERKWQNNEWNRCQKYNIVFESTLVEREYSKKREWLLEDQWYLHYFVLTKGTVSTFCKWIDVVTVELKIDWDLRVVVDVPMFSEDFVRIV
jgi:hypothetical protein